ncbi:MAG: heavy-metal-associated domain-containing protein [Phycisphaerales bacterium]|nr:heavy-metal-associated domain-containing protein [Phycisphaerales bacterium]
MRGNGCRERIAAALQAVPGVRSVDVSLYRARATIVHDRRCDVSELFRATLNTGYNASLPPGAEQGRGSYPQESREPSERSTHSRGRA